MDLTDIVKRGNSLEAKVSVAKYDHINFVRNYSPEVVINGSTQFRLMIEATLDVTYNYVKSVMETPHPIGSYEINNYIFVRFKRRRRDDGDGLTYTATFTSKTLDFKDKRYTSDDEEWHLVSSIKNIKPFDISVRVDVVPCVTSFAGLHSDAELTDFEFRASDGVVSAHRAVLAAASPVLRRMLAGAWREPADGCVHVPDTSRATLQHFKDYVYLHTLPETGFEQLLLLASFYMMPDLKQKCIDKLVENVSPDNAWDMIEFATKHKVPRLMLGILECVQNGVISETDINVEKIDQESKKVIV